MLSIDLIELTVLQDDQKSAAIQRENVSVKSAYDRFKGKTLDGKDIGKTILYTVDSL